MRKCSVRGGVLLWVGGVGAWGLILMAVGGESKVGLWQADEQYAQTKCAIQLRIHGITEPCGRMQRHVQQIPPGELSRGLMRQGIGKRSGW